MRAAGGAGMGLSWGSHLVESCGFAQFFRVGEIMRCMCSFHF